MSTDHQVEEIGKWKKEGVLGAGGFGYVILWRNKETNETIALKECRWGHDPMMTPKHRSRWKLEVDMMSRLNHQNVVRGIPVPPELDVPATEMPLLAMEYCTNGDLRKLLNKSENCCGLKEKHARLIMKHISSAINYLHSMRIIHRDLKPENIVIQEKNGNFVYKLIDLGYAKELDQGSLCTSFVGTLQYLAPELFTAQKYSCTVDYWSLGLVTHEVITGYRPFLPDKSPAEWIPIIKAKKPTEIRAYLDDDKNIVFSTEISPFHHISSMLKNDVEEWLQLMLEWDPKKRGRFENTSAFTLLDSILQKKVALVFCAENISLLSIPVKDNLSIEDFKKELAIKTRIPVNQQELVFPDGHLPDFEKDASQFVSNLEEEESFIFLFDKSDILPSNKLPLPYEIPHAVEKIMRRPLEKIEHQLQRVTWSQAVFHSQREWTLFSRLSQAFKAILIHLVTHTSNIRKTMSKITEEMNQLLAKGSLFRNSLEQDLKSYETQTEIGFDSISLYEHWKETYENLKKVDILRKKITNLETFASSIIENVIELQKSSYCRSKSNTPLQDVHQKILECFAELRHRSSDEKRQMHDNKEIVRLLCLCLQHSHTQVQDLVSIIKKVKQSIKDLEDCQPQFSSLFREIAHWDSQIEAWQSIRQRALWKVIQKLCEKVHQYEKSAVVSPERSLDSPIPNNTPSKSSVVRQETSKATSTLRTPPVIPPPSLKNRLDALSISSSSSENGTLGRSGLNTSMFSGPLSLSSILDQTTEESRNVKRENEKLIESFQNMMKVLKSYPVNDVAGMNSQVSQMQTSPKQEH